MAENKHVFIVEYNSCVVFKDIQSFNVS